MRNKIVLLILLFTIALIGVKIAIKPIPFDTESEVIWERQTFSNPEATLELKVWDSNENLVTDVEFFGGEKEARYLKNEGESPGVYS